MLRITKQSDYGLVLLAQLARSGGEQQVSARALAEATLLPVPMVSKILKTLAQSGLVSSRRGPAGGYQLARPAREISVAQVLDAVEGPIGLTECIDTPGACGLEPRCSVKSVWHRINLRVRAALEGVSLAEMIEPPPRPGPPPRPPATEHRRGGTGGAIGSGAVATEERQ